MHTGLSFWIGFNAVVLVLLALDLFVIRGKEQTVSMKGAAIWSVGGILTSLAFGAWIYISQGHGKALEFITGYVIEYSLSMDNLFVFIMIFAYFKVAPKHQHRVLAWGIIGALVMRGVVICLGVELVQRFGWILYGFGAFLLITGLRMFFKKPETEATESFACRVCRKIPRVTPDFHGASMIVRTAAGWMLTPLALAVVVVDVMDLIFAVDSIPATFAVTRDPFIVYTSNICAILGLRSLYFVLAGMADRFEKLHYGLAAVLGFIGLKMLLANVLHIGNGAALLVVAAILAASIIWSLAGKRLPAGEKVM
jgi:tellurite resistance protein TerC